MKVLIVSGGNSSERKISLISAEAVKEAILKNGFSAEVYDLQEGTGALLQKASEFDVVFPVLHGAEGEGGSLQQLLKVHSLRYVGGDPEGFKQGFYKLSFKKFCDQHQITTAEWKQIQTENQIREFGLPAVLKNSAGGSSREVVLLKSEADIESEDCQNLLKVGEELYVERLLEGIEVTVAILNDSALPVVEIIPPQGKWFDYENKYSGETQEIPNAPSLTEEQRKEAQQIALKIHQTLDLGPFSRIDFIISDNKPYILEVNTIPGLTPNSLFPKAAQAEGIEFPELIRQILESVPRSQSKSA